jgi:hypothetical protein
MFHLLSFGKNEGNKNPCVVEKFEELMGYFWFFNFRDFHFTYLQPLIQVI